MIEQHRPGGTQSIVPTGETEGSGNRATDNCTNHRQPDSDRDSTTTTTTTRPAELNTSTIDQNRAQLLAPAFRAERDLRGRPEPAGLCTPAM